MILQIKKLRLGEYLYPKSNVSKLYSRVKVNTWWIQNLSRSNYKTQLLSMPYSMIDSAIQRLRPRTLGRLELEASSAIY